MIYAHIYEYMQNAHYYACRFVDEHRHEIEKIKRPSRFIILLKNGDEHHFMSWAIYERWCMGRTYMIGDDLYHSGMCVKRGEEDDT